MKKLLALLMALTMTVQLVTPAWADAVEEEPEETTEAVEVVEETTEATEETEEVPEETEAEPEETKATEEVTEPESEAGETTEEPTEETAEPTEIGEEAEDEQVAAVAALIEALPSVEELEGMSEEEQLAAYEQIQGAFEAYDALSEEQKAQIPGAESLFESLFDYLNTQIADFAYSDSYQCGPSLFYNFSSSSGTLSFSGSGTMDNFIYDTIPWRQNRNAITSIVIPEGVTSIGDNAFYGCSKLKSVSLPSTLKSIGDEAFDGCTWLENISIPDGVTRIAKKAFYQCRDLTNVELPSSLKSIGEEAFTECKKLYSISIPYGAETLENGAFARCDGLTYVLIPDTVETIGNWAFTDCIALKVADIPKNVKIIGERAFKSCRRLETEVELKQITDLGEQAFYDCEKITSLVISSSSITEIPNLAFNSCYALQSVTLPDSVTRIGDLAFCGGAFSTFQNPKGLKSVGYSAFAGCKNLTSYVIPDGMTTIGYNFLERCSSLSQVVIPGSVTLVEAGAFDGCASLTDIQFGGSQEDWNNISFGSSNTPVFSANIHYSTQATTLGFGTHGSNISWKITLDGVLQLSGLGKMDAGTGTELKEFPWTEYSKKITAVEIQPGITSIAAYAFDGIQAEISIPLSVTEIGRNAVSASKLPNYSGTTAQWLAVNFDLAADYTHGAGAICNDGTVLDLGVCGDFTQEGTARYALVGDGCLRIYGAGQVTSAPWILNKDKITTVTIEEGITSVCENAFQNCTKLTTVAFPESVTNVEAGAFGGCAGLKTVHYAGTKEQWSQIQIGENNQSLKNAALVCPQSHICILEKVEEVPATCRKAGIIAHWRCTVCGKLFSDAEGSAELKVQDTVSAPVDHTIDSTTGKCTVCGLIGGKCGKTVSWALEASGVLRIYGSGEMSTDKGNIAWKKYAKSITSIVIESGVTRIDKSAFYYTNCTNGTIIYVPLSVTRIDSPTKQSNLVYHYAGTIAQWRAISFYYADNYWEAPGAECTDGTIVTMGYCGTISKGPFYYLDGEGCLHIDGSGPISFYEYYYYRSYWENYSNQIRTVVIGDGVTAIPSYAFNNLHKLEHISIPEGIKYISDSFKDTTALKEIKLPSTLEAIERSAFENSGLESIIIPEGVTSLSDKSFYGCKNLKSVQLPSTLRKLYEGYTFAYCINLTRINFPENLDSISQYAFQGSGIRSAKLPEGLTWIGASAFSKCGNLTYVSVPASATRIDGGAFADNPRLSKVDFQAKVDSLPDSIFKNCPALTSFVIPDGVTTIGKAAFSESGLKTVTIPITVTKIEDNAFASTSLTDVYFDGSQVEWEKITVGSGNDALRNANVHFARVHVCQPEKVADRVEPTCTTAGKLEYWRCDGCGKLYDDANCTNELTQGQLIIPKLGHDMTKTEAVEPTYWAAGNNAYYTCSRCGKVYKDEAGQTETTVEAETLEKLPGVASGECGEKLHWVLTENGTLVISGSGEMLSYSETEVAPWFRYRMKINSLIVEKGITRVGYYAFYGCIKLTSVSLPEGVTVIGDSAFRNCTGLTEVRIPDGVTYLDPGAFYGCSGLISVDIPDSVKNFGSFIRPVYPAVYQGGVFENCTSLKSITIPAGAYVARDTFINCSGLTDVIIKEGIKEIEERTFSGCSSLTSINIPESVTSIGESAFSGCGSLTSVTIPENVTSIGNNAFSGCGTLKTVDIPDGVTSIQFSTFSGCKSLTSVTIPDSIIRIGNSAFYGCSSLASVTIPEGVISIGQSAFSGCSSLTSIIIPDNVARLESGTFRDCSSLTGVSIPENVTSIGESAFYGCSSLKNVDIPDGITSIEANTFYNCSGLENIVVPDSVKSLGDYAFYGCNGLTSFHIPTGVTSVGRQSFDRCTALASIGVPASVTSVGYGAFEGCSNLKDVYYGGDEVAWKQIEIGSWNEPLTHAYLHYGLTHICTTHLIPAVTPTCTTAGNNAYYLCDACGRVYKDEQNREQTTVEGENLPALGHAMTLTEAKAATCTEDGNNAYYTCGNCHKVFLDEQGEKETTAQAEILPALGHSISIVNTVAPTCTEKGNRLYYTCATCGKAFKDKGGLEATTVAAETVPALGHTMTKTEAVAPTCTEKGSNAYYTCGTCEKVFKDALGKQETTVEAEVLEALGHTMVLTEAKAPTCTEPGNNLYYTCKTCGKVYKDEAGQEETTVAAETIPALGHAMTKTEAVAPTCTEAGNNAYYTCSTCHKVYKDEVGTQETTAQAEFLPALGHDMDKTEAVAPTHTSGGSNAYYTCKTCHKVFADAQGTLETTPEQERLPRLPGMADGKSGSLTWFISDEGKLTISGKGRMPDYSGSALAPWYDYREKILALEVEEGVLSMGDYAFFDCENLRSIQLPKSLTKLGKSCFVGCDSLALLDLTQLPKELTQKVTDLTGLAVLPETLSKLAGSKASYQWRLETIEGQPAAKNLAKLDGSQLTVLQSGAFRLVCLEEYTGLEASAQAAAQTTTVIRPEEREQLTSGEKLELSAWAMPFETELTVDWTVTEESQAYATVTKDGILTAKSITKPVQVTVQAVPKNGEDPAEKTIWLLPKTIGMGILVNGHLVGDSLTAELTEAELNLIAQIQPQGAKTEVTWTSSREDVAEISAAGTVKLLKPGITLIRAQSTDGSGVSAELTLKIQYLDGAEKLTLTADADAAGLELGRTAQLTLSGEDTIDPEHVEFQITQGSAATVDAQGLLTAGNVPGKVTIVAALKDDPLQRRAQLTVEIVPVLIRALTLEPRVSQEWGYAEETSGESWVYGEVEAVAGKNRTFQINAQGKDYREAWNQVTNLTYESSDPAVAQVDARGLVTLTAKEAGECVITVRCTDSLGTETRLHIVLRDSAPRLESTKLTLNSNLTAGTTTALVESYNNTIQSVTLYDYNKTTKSYESDPSETFTAEAEDGTLTVRALGAQSSGTYQLKLVVTCLGSSYDFTLQVKVANSLPKVTVKQIGKFDTFYLDSTAQLTATASGYEVERLKLIGADTFRMDEDGNLFYAESYNPGDKIVTKGTLLVYVEGYQVPVEKTVTVATTKTAPKLTLNPSASAVNRALEDPKFRVKVLWKGNNLNLTDAEVKADVGFATVEAQGQYLVFRLTGATGGTAKLSLRLPGWAQAVSLTHKVTVETVENKLPSVKLGTPTLKLNSLFSAQIARTSVWLTQGNLDISTMDFVPAAKEGTTTRKEGEKIALTYDPETENIEAKFKDIPKAGTYSYTYTAYLENGTALPSGTIKVTVAATAPKVKLSAASVKLNRYLAGQEKATVKVTLTGGTGYQVKDFEDLPDYMRYDAETSELTVVLPDETFTGETCYLSPIVRDEESGQEVPLSTKLTLKVQILNTNKLTVSLSAKGKLNTVDPDSAIAYTVTKVNNCLGTVESVDLIGVGADTERFQADLDTSGAKPIVLLRLLPGESYATNKTYKVRFRFTVCGKEVLSSVLSVKVTQTALKVTAPKSAVYYLSQSGPLRCSLKANLPLESVSLSARTAKEFQQALGGQENLRLTGSRVEFKLTNPGALTAGKSYSVQLELLPENAAENTKPTTIKLTVKVMK